MVDREIEIVPLKWNEGRWNVKHDVLKLLALSPITKHEILWGSWYMHLKTENYCLKACVGEKMYKNTCNVI